jgi:hypothetical protein
MSTGASAKHENFVMSRNNAFAIPHCRPVKAGELIPSLETDIGDALIRIGDFPDFKVRYELTRTLSSALADCTLTFSQV